MMNELYCLNDMMTNVERMSRSLWYIYDEFLLPIWIMAVCAIIAVAVWVALGVFSAVTLVKLQKKIMAETAIMTKKEYSKYINKAKRAAKHRVNKSDDEALGEMIRTVAKDKKPIKVEDLL